MKRTIRRLNKALEDPAYKQGWITNIAMAHIDAEDQYKAKTGKKYLNRSDRYLIANEAAENFLNILKG